MSSRLVLLLSLAALVQALPTTAADDIRVSDGRLFATLDANGDGQVERQELSSEHARLFARLVRRGDSNDDGRLSEHEWQQALAPERPTKPIEERRGSELPGADAARLLLLKLDADGDSVLTADEAPSELKGVFNRIVEQYDRNDDGKVNRLELARGGPRLTRMAQQTARRLDLDVDRELKKLDRKQGQAAMRFSEQPSPRRMLGDPQQSLALFEEFDRNNDGRLERDEIPEQARDRLGRLFRLGDRNRDGALSEREFQAASQRASRMMQRMQNTSPDNP